MDGDIFNKTAEAREKWNIEVKEEERSIGEYVEYLELENWNDPAIEYGYADKEGVVDAKELVEGDIINYYYDKDKEPISCAVLFNDNEHGLQVVALSSVRDVILGYDGEVMDEKADEAFENGAPNGYDGEESINGITFEKDRWSYNHALKTLKEYAMEYMGDMAKDARCIGASNDVILQDDDLSNMYVIDSDNELYSFNEKMKAENDFKENGEVDKMQSLGIIQSADQSSYWLAARSVYVENREVRNYYTV